MPKAPAAVAGPSATVPMPLALTNAMRAVIENRNDIYESPDELYAALLAAAPKVIAAPAAHVAADPMDWPLPCDVTVGHGTMRKGVKLRTLVLRMKTLYEMATGRNADEVANRTPEERQSIAEQFLQKAAPNANQAAAREVKA